jgi:hypothetical protein
MHIHSANLNPGLLSAQASQSTQTTRRASETRKKLIDKAAQLDAATSIPGQSTDPWTISMVGAFAGSPQDGSSAPAPQGHEVKEEIAKIPAAGPVSYWA